MRGPPPPAYVALMSLRTRFFALTYDRQMAKTEKAGLRALRERLLAGASGDVLDEQQAAAWAQHPAQLPQRPGLVVDPAQDQRGHRHVEALVIEGQVLGRRA